MRYICEICGKIFKQKSHYTQHKRRKTPCINNIKALKQALNETSQLSNIDNLINNNGKKKCNINFQTQYAYLNKEKCIHINKYIKDKPAKKLYCINGHELIFAHGEKRKPYFRHKNKGDVGGQPMSEWHAEWQGHFPVTEYCCPKRENQIKERRADAFIQDHNTVIEFQHSKPKDREISNRKKDYALHNLKVIWVIDGKNTILEKLLEDSNRVYLEFTEDLWKFERFIDYEYVYIDIDSKIYKVFPNKIKSNMIDVQQPKSKKDFIDSLKNGKDIWELEEPPQSHLYLKQQGAGSGKTYGIIQMLEKEEFKHYTTFIYVTKQHAAKYIIFKEFQSQIYKKQIRYLTDLKENNTNKHFVITYKNEKTDKQCKIIIATIDSLIYCLGNKEQNGFDKFETLVNSIIDGYIKATKNGTIYFARTQAQLNKETMLVLDETQDLRENYAKAIIQIMRDRYIDVYAVADKLQSIFSGDNTFTYFEKNDFSYTKKTRYPALNIVRRFTHPALIRFVNHMIPYTNYELPVMKPYIEKEDIGDPLKMILGKSIYIDDKNNENKINCEVDKIMKEFTEEVTENNRVPEDFLIVTPFTTTNPLADALQLAINQFWIEQFENPNEYLKQHPYWKDHLGIDIYNRYAIFHKSEEGKSIDLSESENATRIVSIHASKGDGRPIVFVIGISENALKKFSGKAGNMQYNSLLHVGITRMKKKLFIRVEDNGDDISRKVMKFFEAEGIEIPLSPNLSISHKSKYNELIDYFGHMKRYEEVNNNIIKQVKLVPLDDNTYEKRIIDMQHHTIRYAALAINLCLEIVRKERHNPCNDVAPQIIAILHGCKDATVNPSSKWKDFNKHLRSNLDDNKKTIPIFQISKKGRDYKKYFKIIKTFIKNIQTKIKNKIDKGDFSSFCPCECIILYYMIQVCKHGPYSDIHINDVYTIINNYSSCYNSSLFKGHDQCLCNKYFVQDNQSSSNKKELERYLHKHYEQIEKIEKIYKLFNKKYPKISWLMGHTVHFGGKNSNFALYKQFQLIGYDQETVIIAYVKPQFNKLNYNETLIKSIFDTYLIRNVRKKKEEEQKENDSNYTKFHGKKIITVILTPDIEDPYYCDWGNLIESNENLLKETVQKYLVDKYCGDSKCINRFYKYWREKCPENKRKPLQFINFLLDKYNAIKKKQIKISFPDYIMEFFNNIKFELKKKRERKRILKQYDDDEYFLGTLKEMIYSSINRFLGLEDDSDEDTDDV